MLTSIKNHRPFLAIALAIAASAAILAPSLWVHTAEPRTEKVDFVRDIQPLFQKHCLECHGSEMQEGGFRLDIRDLARQGGDSGAAYKPKVSGKSLLLELLRTDDEDRRMPQGEDSLTKEDILLVKRWIDQGADWPDSAAGDPDDIKTDHWSFQPLQKTELPEVEDKTWPWNAIDYFVLSRLEKEGLKPSPKADRHALIRRLYLDLIGLSPTPEEADAFADDERADAYERLVDRLLASPRYGERWARRWLDRARYSDTNGYEKDRVRSIWPYRDWVIQALNADMPFDQFTIEQIAGDMLPSATEDQHVATGFHRNTMTNEEGGVDVEEFRFYSLVDRVNTTGSVWLGLTLSCVQCHSHKYDPISQHEYYQLMAYFNNTDEPEMNLSDPRIASQRDGIEAQAATLQAKIDARFAELKEMGKYEAWRKEAALKASRWKVVEPENVVSKNRATMTVLEDLSVLASGDIPNNDVYTIEAMVDLPRITAFRLEALPHESLPDGGPGRAVFKSGAGAKGDFLLGEFSARLGDPASNKARTRIKLKQATHSYALAKRSAALAIDGDLDTGWSIAGRVGEPHHIVCQLSEPLSSESEKRLTFQLDQLYIHQMTIGRFRISATSDAQPVVSSAVPAEVESALLSPPAEQTENQKKILRSYYLQIAPELVAENKKIADLRKGAARFPTSMVMLERSSEHHRETKVHHRGEYLKERDAVQPATLRVLPALAKEAPADRLALARWLVDAKNPLAARVAVNRHWEAFWGRGIVHTLDDFGAKGSPPSHPKLLDYLASEFIRDGWSTKQLHRQIITSAAYRQSSHVSPELLQRDPINILLGCGARVRLEAELIRDQALTVSGLLVNKIGGPSVFPPQPEGVTKLSYGVLAWQTSSGEDRYRRGLYTFSKRTAPFASFSLFDAPSGENCMVRRERSNTPLQALTLLNDTVFVEATRHLAKNSFDESAGDIQQSITRMFRRCLTRPPKSRELQALVGFYEDQYQRLARKELDAAEILDLTRPKEAKAKAESKPSDMAIDRNQLAALTILARVLLNLDETITKE